MGELRRFAQRSTVPARALTPDRVAPIGQRSRDAVTAPLQRMMAARALQPQLEVGAADDAFEREAERTADAMTSASAPAPGAFGDRPVAASLMRVVQRAVGKGDVPTRKDDEDKGKKLQKAPSGAGPEVVPAGIASEIHTMTAGGAPLAPPLRGAFESRFGYDFSGVRVHTGSAASGAAVALGARAFTVGNHVFFGAGEYQPTSAAGRRLIAHELTHTIQQTPASARATRVQRDFFPDPKAAALEKVNKWADELPPWELLTVLLGKNPITDKPVERNARNFMHAALKLVPDGMAIFDDLEKNKTIEKTAAWFDAEVTKLNLTWDGIKALFQQAWDSIGATDFLSPSKAWEKVKAIFGPTLKRIADFAITIGSKILEVIKKAVLTKLGAWAKEQKGYKLLTFVLGKDPVTDEPVERTAKLFIKAVLELVPDGDKIFENLEKAKTIEKTVAWLEAEITKLDLSWEKIKELFKKAWDAFNVADLLHPLTLIEKIAGIFLPPAKRVITFAIAVGKKVLEFIFEGAMIIAGPIGIQIVNIVRKIGDTFNKIVDDPVAFVGNLVQAVKLGLQQFAKNILQHLKTGLIEWLVGGLEGAGLVLPKVWDLKGILDLVLQILGISYAKIRGKLVKVIGEDKMAMLEKVFGFIKTLVTEGPAAAWQQIVEAIGGLWDLVIGGIKDWAISKIVTAAITKLVTMFNPAGAIIQAIIATYNTVAFFIERIKQILALVEAIVDSVANIAAGKLAQAANWVEKAMARTIPVILGFLARLIGLGDISTAVKKVITDIQAKVDKGIDAVIKWVVEKAKSLFGVGDKDADKDKGANAADATEPFAMKGTPHHLRGHMDGKTVKYFMASDDEKDLAQRIADLRLFYTDRFNQKDPKKGAAIGARLDAISARLNGVAGLLLKAPDMAAAAQVARSEEIGIKTMLSALGDEFGIKGLRFTPPTHRFAPQGPDAYLRPTVVVGDPISEASRKMPPSPASGSPAGLSLLPAYERGHLLADSLGGPGGDVRNIAPMSNLTNRGGGGMPRAESAARKAIDDNADPPTILRYTVRVQYRDNGGLEQWATATLGGAPNSAQRLFVAARNGNLADSDLHLALGGAARMPLAVIQANRVKILRQTAYYFLATGFDISIETIEGPAVPSPGTVPNHLGVSLP